MALACEPTGSFDREAYAAKVAMLTDDCADLPDDLLETACNTWRTSKPFLPRANELRESVKAMVIPIFKTGRTWAQRCVEANAKKDANPEAQEHRSKTRWVLDANENGMHLEYRPEHQFSGNGG